MENDMYELIEEEGEESDVENGHHNVGFKETAIVGTASKKLRNRKHKVKHKDKKKEKKMTPFERRYSKLAIEKVLIPERKRIDFVLIHPNKRLEDLKEGKAKRKLEVAIENRRLFEDYLRQEGFSIQESNIGDFTYKKLHCPFKRLCVEAERVKLEMPLQDCYIPEPVNNSRISKFIERHFETDNEVDYVSSQFYMDKISMYQNHQDPSNFFRPALRSLLVYHILINADIRTEKEKIEGSMPDEDDPQSKFDTMMNYIAPREAHDEETEGKNRKVLKKKGLLYLLMKKSYTDSMILHENSEKTKQQEGGIDEHFDVEDGTSSTVSVKYDEDPRRDLDNTWPKFFKFQPLWKIRNYFGEKIAFYFAWSGMLIQTLWVPSLLGIIIFIYGLIKSTAVQGNQTEEVRNNTGILDDAKKAIVGVIDVIKESFDNDATPFFGLAICLWGTIFLEVWKRKRARLAYEWDVEDFESKEPDRPQFFGTKVKKDPVTDEDMWFYPFKRQLLKLVASSSVLIFMMMMVIISVTSVIIYRVVVSIEYCPNVSGPECLLLTTLLSSIFNAVSILILGKLYDRLAVYLTEWENHRTQTSYDDSLIIKLFAFQFVNSYASCFYIAFFRGRFTSSSILEEKYKDDCDGTCMSQLSFQVLVLMLMKPFPKLLKDIIIPFIKRLVLKCPCFKNKVDEGTVKNTSKISHTIFLERERKKPGLGDFTLGEYTEKVIQYGFLMLFAASFPLAPILALVTNLFDIRVDAKRMLWWYRRPIAFIAQDIGMWYTILNFVNIIGVLTNAFLIAFTSSWGSNFSTSEKLWIVIGFEHIVFTLKFVVAAIIPDMPTDVKLAIRREKYQIAKKMDEAKGDKGMNYKQLYPGSRSLNDSQTHVPVDANFMTTTPSKSSVAKETKTVSKPPANKESKTALSDEDNNTPWYISDSSSPPTKSHKKKGGYHSQNLKTDKTSLNDYDYYDAPPLPVLPQDTGVGNYHNDSQV